ncbi:MAG: 4'-phosphopantetheinyl transferase family protein [Acidobacteriota bacterium]
MAHVLPEQHVDVWIARPDTEDVELRLEAYRTVLSAAEVRRAARFVHRDDTVRFIVGRALARTMLSRYVDLPPRDWPFVIDARGRPELAESRGSPDLRFNLTHTRGLVACAITIGREVGVDVEHVARTVTPELPERFFSAREVADLRRRPPHEQNRAFFDYWTLKEAYIKARGLGLALPLGQFTFVLSPEAPPAIAFGPELDDDPASWQFAQFWPTGDHRMAVAVRRRGTDLPVRLAVVVPEVAR